MIQFHLPISLDSSVPAIQSPAEAPALTEEELLRSASFAPLLRSSKTPSAKKLEETLVAATLQIESAIQKRARARTEGAQKSFALTVSAFVADLVAACAPELSNEWCFRSLDSTTFTDTLASKRQFEMIVDCWKHSGFIEVKKGFRVREGFDLNPNATGQRWATRFRATKCEPACKIDPCIGVIGVQK